MFFLAMAHTRLGNRTEARDAHAKALDRHARHSDDPELARFREEAAALIQD